MTTPTRTSRSRPLLALALLCASTAQADPDVTRLENQIRSILQEKTNAPIDRLSGSFCKDTALASDRECVQQLTRLRNTLLKIKHFKDLSELTEISIYSDPKRKSATFYWKGKTDLLFLSTQDPLVPWMSLFSAAPLEEDAPEFEETKAAALIQGLRDRPLGSDKRKPRSSELPYRPYSSSYLALREGNILKNPKTPIADELISDRVQKVYGSQSPMERFARARRSYLGLKDQLLTDAFRKRVHIPDAEEWEGFCHQSTAAAGDQEINEFIASTQGLVCGDIYISEGELEELVTLLYSKYRSRLLAGQRTERPATEADRRLRNEMGLDDMPASEFHKNVFQYLEKKKGIGLETSPDVDIFNHPVYRAETSNTILTGSPRLLTKIAPLIPADLLRSDSPEDKTWLRRYRAVDLQLRRWQSSENELSTSDREWLAQASHFMKELLDRPMPELLALRNRLLLEHVVPGLASGRVRLGESVTAEAVTTQVEHGEATPFATTGPASSSRSYNYVLFKRNGKIIDSRWISHPKERPDFIWIADPNRSSAIQELLRLGEVCQNARDVFSFFGYLRQSVSDGVIDDGEKQEIRSRYPAVAGVIQKDQLRRLFSQENLPGMDPMELFQLPYPTE